LDRSFSGKFARFIKRDVSDRTMQGYDSFLLCHHKKIKRSECLKGTSCLSLIIVFAIAPQEYNTQKTTKNQPAIHAVYVSNLQ